MRKLGPQKASGLEQIRPDGKGQSWRSNQVWTFTPALPLRVNITHPSLNRHYAVKWLMHRPLFKSHSLGMSGKKNWGKGPLLGWFGVGVEDICWLCLPTSATTYSCSGVPVHTRILLRRQVGQSPALALLTQPCVLGVGLLLVGRWKVGAVHLPTKWWEHKAASTGGIQRTLVPYG